jgi:hypothetical protein
LNQILYNLQILLLLSHSQFVHLKIDQYQFKKKKSDFEIKPNFTIK